MMEEKKGVQLKADHFILGVIMTMVSIFLLGVSFPVAPHGQGNTAWAAAAGSLDPVIAAANKEGKLMWYESSPDDQFAKVEAAFSKQYPKIRLEQTRLRGAEV